MNMCLSPPTDQNQRATRRGETPRQSGGERLTSSYRERDLYHHILNNREHILIWLTSLCMNIKSD